MNGDNADTHVSNKFAISTNILWDGKLHKQGWKITNPITTRKNTKY